MKRGTLREDLEPLNLLFNREKPLEEYFDDEAVRPDLKDAKSSGVRSSTDCGRMLFEELVTPRPCNVGICVLLLISAFFKPSQLQFLNAVFLFPLLFFVEVYEPVAILYGQGTKDETRDQ
jgi:hypothetical protein